MTVEELKTELELAESEFREARGEYEYARNKRNALVLKAIAGGIKAINVAAITGLTRGRINQIQDKGYSE